MFVDSQSDAELDECLLKAPFVSDAFSESSLVNQFVDGGVAQRRAKTDLASLALP